MSLGDGSHFGIQLSYAEQPSPDGLAQAFIIGEAFIGDDDVCLILGDNTFYGVGLQRLLMQSVQTVKSDKKAIVFGNYVDNPKRYGVAEFDGNHNVVSLEENLKTRNLTTQWWAYIFIQIQ